MRRRATESPLLATEARRRVPVLADVQLVATLGSSDRMSLGHCLTLWQASVGGAAVKRVVHRLDDQGDVVFGAR